MHGQAAESAVAERPLVSVIVPAYNRAATIAATLRTITTQTGWPFEIIVVDDGSQDGTADIAKNAAPDARVVIQHNQRRSAARNNGAALAKGEFLYFFDSDDLMEPGAIARLAGALAADDTAALAYGPVLRFVDDPAVADLREPFVAATGDLLAEQLETPFLIPIMTMVRRGWFERVGGMTTKLDYGEDFHFFLKLSACGARFVCAGATPVARYREYANCRIPGSVHVRGLLTALRMIDDEFGLRLPASIKLKEHVARMQACYAMHALREGRHAEAWREWLASLKHSRRYCALYGAYMMLSPVVPMKILDRCALRLRSAVRAGLALR